MWDTVRYNTLIFKRNLYFAGKKTEIINIVCFPHNNHDLIQKITEYVFPKMYENGK